MTASTSPSRRHSIRRGGRRARVVLTLKPAKPERLPAGGSASVIEAHLWTINQRGHECRGKGRCQSCSALTAHGARWSNHARRVTQPSSHLRWAHERLLERQEILRMLPWQWNLQGLLGLQWYMLLWRHRLLLLLLLSLLLLQR